MKKSTKETLEVVGIIGAVALAARWLIHRHQNTAALAHINSPAGQHTTSDDVAGVGALPTLDAQNIVYRGATAVYSAGSQNLSILYPCGPHSFSQPLPPKGSSQLAMQEYAAARYSAMQHFVGIQPGNWQAQAKLFIDHGLMDPACSAQMPSSQTATATMHAVTPPPLHRS